MFRLFRTQMVGSPRPRTLAILLMWSRCSSLSLPTGADQRCTKENHKILLQFNLHKLQNLCKIICNSKNYFYTYWSIQSYTFFHFKCRFNKKIEIIFNL
jgi:hypothetical protein